MPDFETTDRGFIYGRVVDPERQTTTRVQESSAIGRPHVYIFTTSAPPEGQEHPSPHLDAEQVEAVIVVLFVTTTRP